MNTRGIIILGVILVALSGGYYLSVQSDVDEYNRAEEAKIVFDDIKADRIGRISVTRLGQQTIEGTRNDDGSWSIVKPFELRAAGPAWEGIAAELPAVKRQRSIDVAGDDLSTYGLDEPKVAVAFTMKDGVEHAIHFGAAEPSQRYRYAQIDGGSVALIDNASFQHFDRSLNDLRNRFLVGMGQSTITRMELTRFKEADERVEGAPPETAFAVEQQTVVFERNDEGKWWQIEPVDALAHQQNVEAMASAVQFAVGEEHIDRPESLADYGLDPARARLVAHLENGESFTVYFGEMTGAGNSRRMYAKNAGEPSVYVVDPQVPLSFPKSPNAFRDHRLLTRGLSGIEQFEIETKDEKYKLGLDEEGAWQIVEPTVEPSDQATASNYLSYLAEAEGESFPGVEMAEGKLDDPLLTLRLWYGGEDAPVEIPFGEPGPDPETRFALQDTGEPILVRDLLYNAFNATLFNFRPKRLCPVRANNVRSLDLTLDGTQYRFENTQNTWLVRLPEKRVLERQSDMHLILDALCNAKALESADVDAAAAGIDDPVLTMQVNDGTTTVRYAIGASAGDNVVTRYAQVEGSDEIFVIEQRVLDRVREAIRGVVEN